MSFPLLEQSRTLYRELDGVINSKQTRQLKPYASISSGPARSISLEVPKAGFLKRNNGFNANLEAAAYSKNQADFSNTYNHATNKKTQSVSLALAMTILMSLLMILN